MNSTAVTLIATVLGAIASALTVVFMIVPVIKRYMLRAFDQDVMEALGRETPRYKAFHEAVFASEIDRGRRAADIASGVQHDLQQHREEMGRFINRFDGQQQVTLTVAQNVVHLDETMKRLDRTLDKMGSKFDDIADRVGQVAVDVAELRGMR